MKVTKVKFPTTSTLNVLDYDYSDSYQGKYLDTDDSISLGDIGQAFFTSAPAWTQALFALRNKIAPIFGLKVPDKTEDPQGLAENFQVEPNERLGLFMVYSKTENEVIMGEDDQHLNFRVSLLREDDPSKKGLKSLTISTTVDFKNRFGKLYFLPVKPFHQLIVPAMLKRTIKQLENSHS